MTDPTALATPESLGLAEIEARHRLVPSLSGEGTWCADCNVPSPCDVAVVLAAYVDRARAFTALAKTAAAARKALDHFYRGTAP